MNNVLTQIIIKLLESEMRKPGKEKANLVYLSPVLLWVGIVCTGIFLIPGLFVPLSTGEWDMALFFLAFAALGCTLIIAYCNCRIRYSDTEFKVKFFLGYRRTFHYAEIESIQGKQRDVKLRVRGCTVRLDEAAVGKAEFLAVARKQYRIAHGGKAIPEVKKRKFDLFNGHVDNPGEFLSVYLLIPCFMIVMLLIGVLSASPTPLEELTYITASVESGAVSENDLVLHVDGRVLEIWSYERALGDTERFLQDCSNGTEYTIGYRTVTNDEDEITGYCIEYLEDQAGEIWITPREAYINRFWEVGWVFAGFCLIWLCFCGISVYVGRNPHKFSKRTIRLFFKDGYVH